MNGYQTVGENVAVEFKSCGSGIGNDVYESICCFLNRFGGDLFMGVGDDGRVVGVPENAVSDMIKNFIKCIGNPNLLSPMVSFTGNYRVPRKNSHSCVCASECRVT